MHTTLQQLRLFEAVARLGSFTRAAEAIHLTQPAVSIQVKRLEENAGMPLFEQVGKRIFLTDAGREMYAASRDILDRIQELEQSLEALRGEVAGNLEVSVVTTAKYFLPHLLGAFLRRYPRVVPRLTVTNREKVLQRLADNSDDLYVMGQVPRDSDVEAHPFLDNELVIVANPEHPLAAQRDIPLGRIAEERFLFRERGSGTRVAFERLLAEHEIALTPYMELGSGEAIKQGVMAGIGVGILSRHSLRLELSNGLLRVLDVQGLPLRRRWYAVHLRGKRLSLTAQKFLEFLLSEGIAVCQDNDGR